MKAKFTKQDGSVGLVLGISAENVRRLQAGDPIFFDPKALHIAPGTAISGVLLFYGADENALTRMLKTFIGPTTEIISVPRGDDRRPQ